VPKRLRTRTLTSSWRSMKFISTWLQVLRHMPEIQVFHDKEQHILLLQLNYIETGFEITVFRFFNIFQFAPMLKECAKWDCGFKDSLEHWEQSRSMLIATAVF